MRILLIIISIFAIAAPAISQPLRGDDARVWQEANAAAQQGRHAEALEKYKTVLGKTPNPSLFAQAGALLVRQGAQPQAEELYLWGRKQLKQPQAFASRLAELYQSQLKHDRAVAEWMKLLPAQPDLVKVRLGEISQHLGQEKTAELVEANLKGAGDAGRLLLGGLRLSAGDDRRAWQAFSGIKDVRLLWKAVDQMLASAAPAPMKTAALEGYLERCGGKDPDALAKLGTLFLETRQFQRAGETFRKMLPMNGPLASVMMARTELGQGRPGEAIRTLSESGTARWPDSLRRESLFLEAEARLMSGEESGARALYRRISGDSSAGLGFRQRAAFLLAETHLMSGEADSALAGYRRATALGLGGEPSNDALLRMILISEHKAVRMDGLSLLGKGLGERARYRFDQAARDFAQAAENYPGTTLADQAMLETALMYEERGEHRQAAVVWRRLAESATEELLSCRASYRQGMALKYGLEKPDEAAEVWKRAIVKNPDFSWSDLMRQELTMIQDKK